MAHPLSPLARVVLDQLVMVGPWTVADLASATKLPPSVVDAALAELVNAGRAVEVEPRRFEAR